MRNVAIQNADTEWVLYIEADMVTQTNLSMRISNALSKGLFKRSERNRIDAYILPLFYPPESLRLSSSLQLPQEKISLTKMGYKSPAYRSHSYMNYTAWLASNDSKSQFVWKDVSTYIPKLMEPYYLIKKSERIMKIFTVGDTLKINELIQF